VRRRRRFHEQAGGGHGGGGGLGWTAIGVAAVEGTQLLPPPPDGRANNIIINVYPVGGDVTAPGGQDQLAYN